MILRQVELQVDDGENVLENGRHLPHVLATSWRWRCGRLARILRLCRLAVLAGLHVALDLTDDFLQLVDFVVLLGDEAVKDVAVLEIVEVLLDHRLEFGVAVVFGEELDPVVDVPLRHLLLADVLRDVLEDVVLVHVAAEFVLLRQEVVELLVVDEQTTVLADLALALRPRLLQTLLQKVQFQSELFSLLVVDCRLFVEFVQPATHLQT